MTIHKSMLSRIRDMDPNNIICKLSSLGSQILIYKRTKWCWFWSKWQYVGEYNYRADMFHVENQEAAELFNKYFPNNTILY